MFLYLGRIPEEEAKLPLPLDENTEKRERPEKKTPYPSPPPPYPHPTTATYHPLDGVCVCGGWGGGAVKGGRKGRKLRQKENYIFFSLFFLSLCKNVFLFFAITPPP